MPTKSKRMAYHKNVPKLPPSTGDKGKPSPKTPTKRIAKGRLMRSRRRA